MSPQLIRYFRISAVSIALTIMASFWLLKIADGHYQSDYNAKTLLIPRTPLINGLRLNLGEGVDVSPRRRQAGGFTLVLVTADTCSPCELAYEKWLQIIRTVHFSDRDELLIVSMFGSRLPDMLSAEAQRHSIASETIHVTNTVAFTTTAGLVATPTTVVIDDGFRLRFIGQRLGESDLRALRLLFGRDAGVPT